MVAQIGAAHGLKGEVRLKSFTGVPADVAGYGPLSAPDGRVFEIAALRQAGAAPDLFIARLKGVGDRTAAEKLTNLRLSVPQERLPPPGDDEYFHADLIGLDAVTPDGAALGTVVAVHNYGAGDLIEIAPSRGKTFLVPFRKQTVPEVDLAGKRIVVDPPDLVEDNSSEEEAP